MSLIYQSRAMQRVLERARKFARTSACVLLCGESGTGKELLARAVHQQSPRAGEPFGHEAGAFTGAGLRRIGRFEAAGAGTVLLDEIGELPLPVQPKLLRVLEEREFQRVGGNDMVQFPGRVVAATNRDLLQEVRRGRFREDLYHRLSVLVLTVPPLRERREDIPALVNHFVQQCQPELDRNVRGVTRMVMQQLSEYAWPGNVRELKNVILRGCVLAPSEVVECVELPDLLHDDAEGESDWPAALDRMSLDEIERLVILQRLRLCHGNKTEAAAVLGVTPRTLRNKLQEYRRLGLTG
jgi:DNA-binding NtrC family response regulator